MNKVFDSIQLTLLNVGFASLDHRWNYDNVISPFSRVYYITEGIAEVFHNNRIFKLKKNHLYLIPSYTYSRYSCDEFMEQYYASFLEEIGNGISIYHLKSFLYEIPATKLDLDLFKRLLEINPKREIMRYDPKTYDNNDGLNSFRKKNDYASVASFIESKGILLSLISRFIQQANSKIDKPITDSRLSHIIRYIRENLNEPLTVKELSENCNLNPDYFSRIFYEQIGSRPIDYINTQRIARAQLLLITTQDTMNEIASKIGMNNLPYFSRVFKKYTGKTPSQYRKQECQPT